MELLIMYLGTVVASFGMEMANEMRMFKDAADNGYKIDIKRLAEFGKQMNPEGTKTTRMSLLMPILNIFGVLQRTMQYNNARPMILTQLDVMDSLVEMTKDEEEQYQANPTGLNALVLTIKSEVNKDKDVKTVSFNDGEDRSSISYKEDKNGNRVITKAEGPVSKLSVIEQQAKIDEVFSDLGKAIKERLTEDELRKLLKDGSKKGDFTLDISNMPVREELTHRAEPTTDVSLSEQKQQLEQLRDYVVSNNTPITEEKGSALSKKHK